jgi:hypothetical protein
MSRLMLYGSRLRGYAPYAHGLRSGSAEWIVLRMARKRKLANCLSYSDHWINFYIIYYPLYMLIMQAHLDSGDTSWLWSHFWAPVDIMTPAVSLDFDCASLLRSMSTPPILPPQLWNILHGRARWLQHLIAGHLVRNRLGGTHNLFSVQNLKLHSFTCRSSQARCHATKEHLACRGLRPTWVSRGTRYPTILEDQGLRMSGQTSI